MREHPPPAPPPGPDVAPARLAVALARLRSLAPLVPVVLLGVAAVVLHRELAAFRYQDLAAEVSAVHGWRVGLALLLSLLNYAALTVYDVLALRHLGRRLPYRTVGPAAFVAFAFQNNVGGSVLSSGGVRWRLYGALGLSLGEVGQVVAMNAATFWLGLLTVGGAALLAGGAPAGPLAGAGPVAGAALLGAAALYLLLAARVRGALRLGSLELRLPAPPLALLQLLAGALDWALAASILWALLPSGTGLGPASVAAIFLAAQLAGVVSHVPAGVGVFEAVVLAALSPHLPAPAVLGLLVLYRLVAYVVPFSLAALLLAAGEVLRRRHAIAGASRAVAQAVAPAVPAVAAAGAFLAGAVLLASGATPTVPDRLHLLRRLVPLPALEASHLVGSVAGMGLLLLAQALRRRLDGAWLLAVALLGTGVVASLAKGLDVEEAALLLVLLLALLPFRAQFRRRASLLAEPLAAGWWLAAAAVAGASIWIGLFSYRHLEYSSELWWEFAFRSDAPRFLRASVAALTVALAAGVAALLRAAPPRVAPATLAELDRVRPLVARSPESAAHLALLGDKAFLLDEAGEAFLMYGAAGRVLVSMGDPVGAPAAATELCWRLTELADRHHGHACFYQVPAASLPRYLDLGLTLFKLGEEATVPLSGFSLEGGERRGLRQAVTRAERDGLRFEVATREAVPALLPALRRVSDAWLSERNTREKGFSLGFFDERYLAEGPVAVARLGGELVAFANLWAGEDRAELSLDLMRHLPTAPRGTMDFLFAQVMAWGREQGYGRFNLGMAPFSGMRTRLLAPLWSRLGALVFRHGEHFYNFQGLRQYKEKFHPDWSPRYLAAPGGLALPGVLAGVASLVNRGLGGAISR
jgi:phosphatidylglycerol lysyltransferase